MRVASDQMTGMLKSFDNRKGFGFLIPDDPGPTMGRDVFVHVTQTGSMRLTIGQRFAFDLAAHDGKGLQATNLRSLSDPMRVAAAAAMEWLKANVDATHDVSGVRGVIAALENALSRSR